MADSTKDGSAVEPHENENSLVHKHKKQKISDNKIKPARRQVDPATVSEKDRPPQTGNVFNIWYLKWSGGDNESSAMSQVKADGRCNIAKDSGYTRADKVENSYFCLYFARGLCINGKNCDYLHRLPEFTDVFPSNVDCFGRDKFADYREDMGGVGSILRQNRTLYVGRIHVSSNMDEVVNRHFSEWGDIERIRVLNDRGVAFVTYRNEANAQFAREAMAHQSLDHDEVLNVRWANEDPNPLAKRREQKRIEENAVEAIKKLLPEFQTQSKKTTRHLTGSSGSGSGFGIVSTPHTMAIEGKKEGEKKGKEGEQEKERENDPQNGQHQEETNLISADALESLKALTARKSASQPQKPKKKTLVAYSDSESD